MKPIYYIQIFLNNKTGHTNDRETVQLQKDF